MFDAIQLHIDNIQNKIALIDQKIDSLCQPFNEEINLLLTISGINKISSAKLVAEIGVDMNVVPTPQDLASWVGRDRLKMRNK